MIYQFDVSIFMIYIMSTVQFSEALCFYVRFGWVNAVVITPTGGSLTCMVKAALNCVTLLDRAFDGGTYYRVIFSAVLLTVIAIIVQHTFAYFTYYMAIFTHLKRCCLSVCSVSRLYLPYHTVLSVCLQCLQAVSTVPHCGVCLSTVFPGSNYSTTLWCLSTVFFRLYLLCHAVVSVCLQCFLAVPTVPHRAVCLSVYSVFRLYLQYHTVLSACLQSFQAVFTVPHCAVCLSTVFQATVFPDYLQYHTVLSVCYQCFLAVSTVPHCAICVYSVSWLYLLCHTVLSVYLHCFHAVYTVRHSAVCLSTVFSDCIYSTTLCCLSVYSVSRLYLLCHTVLSVYSVSRLSTVPHCVVCMSTVFPGCIHSTTLCCLSSLPGYSVSRLPTVPHCAVCLLSVFSGCIYSTTLCYLCLHCFLALPTVPHCAVCLSALFPRCIYSTTLCCLSVYSVFRLYLQYHTMLSVCLQCF